MAKGKRKRANNKKPDTKKVEEKKPKQEFPNIIKKYPVKTLSQIDVERFKELIALSNNVAALLKSATDEDMSIAKGKKFAKEMRKGIVKGPVLQRVSQNLMIPLTDMKKVADKLDSEINMLKEANGITKAQLQQRYDEYVDSLRAMTKVFTKMLLHAPEKQLQKIKGDRKAKMEEQEQVIFEKEFEKLTEKDKEFLSQIGKEKPKPENKPKTKDEPKPVEEKK
jgi:hypothetical protein